MRSLLVISNLTAGPKQTAASMQPLPETILSGNGYHMMKASSEERAKQQIGEADAIVLNLPLNEVKQWGKALMQWKRVPLLWWCGAASAGSSAAFCEDDVLIDGILTPSMSEQEIHWALHFGAKQSFERQQWINERKQLESRLEERKWIDMAKGILCKIKNVSEAEAYDLLRKQAMNERKRMVDVATSIVKVYQLLQEQK
ncbi:ANTAR domain-containing response regulator [Paenibacillus sp. NEAU-GSW1]|uniref:ANTAR domain-containing response regulator n=1 Tax=Paenibacillus sp. NEAU-GSW1 TaxID=2682486 RepID=UPI0012E108E3|nr:ANTAR domain-containing protein [Paenibacillus sp. NEAU-GSW1]MUT66577.1 ANTAR domain-containing protein [Paenibacillus sp. NEAU-GSW1]